MIMDSLMIIADEVYHGLEQVKPSLSAAQHGQINNFLLREGGIVHQVLQSNNAKIGQTLDLKESCRQLSNRLGADVAVPATWISFVVRAMSSLHVKEGADSTLFVTHLWHHVALAVEGKSDGLGRVVLRAGIESLASSQDLQLPTAIQMPSPPLLVLMDFVIANLRSNGNPSTIAELSSDRESDMFTSSRAGLALAIEAAAVALRLLQDGERGICQNTQIRQASSNQGALRWNLHIEVLRLLRVCRFAEIRTQLVLTLVNPLYHGWNNTDALEDMWTFIGSANKENIELHIGILCIVAEDLMRTLALPTRSSSEFWDVLYLSISSPADLCRRRGLHVLHQVLAWADRPGNKDSPSRAQVDGENILSSQGPCRRSELPPSDATRTEWKFSGDCLLQWTDYARILRVLEVETEIHLLDQVIPTMTRLCSKVRPAASGTQTPPLPTEFRWIGVLLGVMLQGGTVARRRNLIHRIVTGRLGLGTSITGEAGSLIGGDQQSLALIHEAWVAQVFLPALDNVGWDSSVAKGNLHDFAQSVTEFLRCYVEALSVTRVAALLTLVFKVVREGKIVSIGALSAVLAAFVLDSKRVAAMGPDILFQLKDTLAAVLPPLDQAQRVLVLDGMVHILGAFTDYERIKTSLPIPGGLVSTAGPGGNNGHRDLVLLVMAVLAAIPEDLAKRRYLATLVSWINGLFSRDPGGLEVWAVDEQRLWRGMYRDLLERYLQAGVNLSSKGPDPHGQSNSNSPGTTSGGGRVLCMVGLIVSESFALNSDREQVLANGLSPVVNILRKCWHEPYLNPTTVQAALTFFSCWASVNDATPWRYVPLGPCVDEVVTLVAAQLSTAIADASKARNQGASDDGLISGGAAQVLLNALSAATRYVTILPESSSSCPIVPMLDAYPGVVSFRDQCVQLLTRWREVPLSPIAHLLAIASLDILFRAQENLNWNGNQRIAGGGDLVEGTPRHTLGNLSVSSAEEVVLSLLQNKLDGRISSHHGQHGSNSEWTELLKEHEVRKWSCLKTMLPSVLVQPKTMNNAGPVCHTIVDGLRDSLREELPTAMGCFRTVFPCYLLSVAKDDRGPEFTRIFKLVWGVFKEVRRPQAALVQDLIAGVLHPDLFSMPELIGDASSMGQAQVSPLVGASNTIREFGSAHKPNVIQALVGKLTVVWRQMPGCALQFVPVIGELALFKGWGRGVGKISSNELPSATEAPRLILLLFIESHVIPAAAAAAAAGGDEDSRRVLRALTLHLMELQNSTEFRQCSITDGVTYGRKLRAWQALCVLCGYLCHTSLSTDEQHIAEVIRPINRWFWAVHRRTSLPPVRQHMEVFAARMCKSYPDIFIPSVIKELSDFRLPGQVLCSLLIVAGHTLIGEGGIKNSSQRISLFKVCLPWMVGTHVMGRMIAQLVCHTVLPEAVADAGGVNNLESLFSFLQDSPDMVKMRKRQLEAFSQADCVAMCTVAGMLDAHCVGSNGDITPKHLVDILHEIMDAIWNESTHDKRVLLEDGREWHQTMAEVKTGAWFEDDPEPLHGVDSHIQQKILPWDKLELAVEVANASSLEQTTAAGKRRQSIVLCATLVDKVPNLAGLARSCEIFAASSLVIPDLRLVKHPSFSLISTGAEQWLPIEEVGERGLPAWLRRAKRQGYTLVGVEQTNNSICLTKMNFPENVVLVLGREQSGLPLSIINEMDWCCQIPQQGVLRSLNAHVSGALVLWEYTRQMLASSDS